MLQKIILEQTNILEQILNWKIINKIPEILGKAKAAVNMLSGKEDSLVFDHIGFQMATHQQSLELVEAFKSKYNGEIIKETNHHDRWIYIVKLNAPIKAGSLLVKSVEISDPKPNVEYKSSILEHIAFSYTEQIDDLIAQAKTIQEQQNDDLGFAIKKPPFKVGESQGFKPVFPDTPMIEIRNDRLVIE